MHPHTGIYSRYSCSNIKQVGMYATISAGTSLMHEYSITVVTDLLHKVVKTSSVESSGPVC